MAVKPEVIKARLKALFPKANLSQKRLDAFAAKLAPKPADDADDTAVDAIINDYNDVIDFVAVAQEDDRTRTLEADKKKAEEASANKGGNGGKKDEEEEEQEPEGMTPFEKRMLKEFGALKSDLDSIKTGNVLQTKKQTASQLFEKSDVLKGLKDTLKSKWIDRINVDSETSIEDQIKDLETEYSELVQVNADNNQYGGAAGGGSNNSKPDEAIVNSIVDNLNI